MEIKLGFLYVGDASIVEGHMKICSNGAVWIVVVALPFE
jgi:hypothetical protein